MYLNFSIVLCPCGMSRLSKHVSMFMSHTLISISCQYGSHGNWGRLILKHCEQVDTADEFRVIVVLIKYPKSDLGREGGK